MDASGGSDFQIVVRQDSRLVGVPTSAHFAFLLYAYLSLISVGLLVNMVGSVVSFICGIVYRGLHVNLRMCVVNMQMGWMVGTAGQSWLVGMMIAEPWFLFSTDISFVHYDQFLRLALAIGLSGVTVAASSYALIIVERTYASYAVRTYERRQHVPLVMLMLSLLWPSGIFLAWMCGRNVRFFCYVSFSMIPAGASLLFVFYCVHRWTLRRYRAALNSRDASGYTLSQQFQMAENMRTAKPMWISAWALLGAGSLGSGSVLFCWALGSQRPAIACFLRITPMACANLAGIICMTVSWIRLPRWKATNVEPVETSKTDGETKNRMVDFAVHDGRGRPIAVTADRVADMYFDLLRKGWE